MKNDIFEIKTWNLKTDIISSTLKKIRLKISIHSEVMTICSYGSSPKVITVMFLLRNLENLFDSTQERSATFVRPSHIIDL